MSNQGYTGREPTTKNPPKCEHCDGAGWVDKPGKPETKRWAGGEFKYPRPVERCRCLRRRIAKTRIHAVGIPEKMLEWRLGNFDPTRSPTAAMALSCCQQLVDAWPTSKGLLLHGPPGVGKTRLAVGTLRAIVDKNRATLALFLPEEALYARLQAAFKRDAGKTESDVLDEIAGVDLLVLDDLGSRRVSDWSSDVVGTLVGRRWNAKQSTIVTTNYSGAELHERVGDRTLSRLASMAVDLKIEGDDQRVHAERANLLDFPEPGSDG